MSDILIRGYSMPASCATCHFNNNMFCDVLGLKIKIPVDYIERPGACPLHELPPHGDLIDRNELLHPDPTTTSSPMAFSACKIIAAPVIVPPSEEIAKAHEDFLAEANKVRKIKDEKRRAKLIQNVKKLRSEVENIGNSPVIVPASEEVDA